MKFSVPLLPTGFNYTREYHETATTTITLAWNPSPGSGPEAIVDNYIISISPQPLSHSSENIVLSSPWNVSLSHNTIYSVNITAANCAGLSDTYVLPNIEYGKNDRCMLYDPVTI